MSHTRLQACLLLLSAVLVVPHSVRAQNGESAPSASLQFSLVATDAEVVVNFAMDSSYVAGRLPRGVKPFTMRDMAARGDSTIGILLGLRPDYASRVFASFSVAKIDSTAVGKAGTGKANVIAYWWVPVEVVDPSVVPAGSAAANGEAVVELAFWSNDEELARQLGTVMPNVSKAAVRMRNGPSGTWRGEFNGSGSRIVASCRLVGEAEPMPYDPPAYVTVWAGGSEPGARAVYTYTGHRSQPCVLNVDVDGEGPLARALRGAVMFGGTNLSGWRAHAAAYPRQ